MYIPEWTWQRGVVFTFAEANFPLEGLHCFLKSSFLAVCLSILKRSIWSSILTGLVPCARECCKEESGKPLGPYFQFLPDKGKSQWRWLHSAFAFLESSCCQPHLLVTQPQFWTFTRGKKHPAVMKNLSITFGKLLVLFQTSPVTQLGFILKCDFTSPTSSHCGQMLGWGMLRFLDRSTLLQVDLAL